MTSQGFWPNFLSPVLKRCHLEIKWVHQGLAGWFIPTTFHTAAYTALPGNHSWGWVTWVRFWLRLHRQTIKSQHTWHTWEGSCEDKDHRSLKGRSGTLGFPLILTVTPECLRERVPWYKGRKLTWRDEVTGRSACQLGCYYKSYEERKYVPELCLWRLEWEETWEGRKGSEESKNAATPPVT